MLALGGALLLIPSKSLVLSFSALFVITIGAAATTPLITLLLMRAARPVLGAAFGMLGRMAARDVVATLSRTSVAIAALMIAISVTIGVGLMVGSFRQTVIQWLDQTLRRNGAPAPSTRRMLRLIVFSCMVLSCLVDVGLRLCAGHVLIQIRQARCLGNVLVVHALPALGHLPLAHKALGVREGVFDFQRGAFVN